MSVKSRKMELKEMFQPLVDLLGYKFSPDSEIVDFLLEQEIGLEKETGIPYCPCQGRTYDRKEDMKIVCPCIPFHRDHFDYMSMSTRR
jgi:ferredoxin-thioredoxin reductase catalytic subunit